jgi:Tol biopolymer transport system component
LDKTNYHLAISPDGLSVAFAERHGDEGNLTVASLKDKQIVKVFKIVGEKVILTQLAWSPDGRNLEYISADGEFKNNALWRQPLDGRSARKIADLGDAEISELFGFALAPDGKHFAVAQGGWKHDAVLLKGLK